MQSRRAYQISQNSELVRAVVVLKQIEPSNSKSSCRLSNQLTKMQISINIEQFSKQN